jgi:glutathionylspermidine synthase
MATMAQAFARLPDFDGWRPVIGLWTIGDQPRGMGVREDRHLVTGRGARFVPHLIAA